MEIKIQTTSKDSIINPLVVSENTINRIKEVSSIAKKDIDNFLNMKEYKYIGFNFDFKPYTF